jgi:hypothetical protein
MLTKDKLAETLLSELKEECLMILSLLNQLETPGVSENQEDEILDFQPVLLIWKYTPEKPRNRLSPERTDGSKLQPSPAMAKNDRVSKKDSQYSKQN